MSRNSGLLGGTDPILSFEDRNEDPGFSVVDHLDRRRCEVRTAETVSTRAVSGEQFHLPIDCAVAITTHRLTVPHTVVAYVRNQHGALIDEVTKGDQLTFPDGFYQIELTAPIKLYVVADSGFEIAVTADQATLVFDEATEVYLGARSNHDHPAATITTTEDPRTLMRVVSMFGSALKTTSCERSYPTLRGHPPRIERGHELSIPDGLDAPETRVTIKVPPAYESIYVVAPLAYYLGAEVVPGSDPSIVTDDGVVHRLDDSREFEHEVERVLKQCFFLDCVTRTEGYYPVDLHERHQIEEEVALDFSALYGRPLAEQIEAYLDVPYEVVKPHVPRWKVAAHVDPVAAQLEALPFLAQDLAVILPKESPPISEGTSDHTAESLGISEFVRGDDDRVPEDLSERQVVRIDGTDALEDVWHGDGIPIGASKGMIEAYRNRLERAPSDGNIDITVVVNDPEMFEEYRDVNYVYGSREDLPFDVTVVENVKSNELADIFRTNSDFLHYIGHVDEDGFDCSNDKINMSEIDDVNVDSFFLNACDSYQQAKHLVKSGSIAGVATLAPIPNDEAHQVGKKLARLLNLGFPFYAAINIASSGQKYRNYTLIGDGSINIAQLESDIASLLKIVNDDCLYRVKYETYPTMNSPLGSMTTPHVNKNNEYFLTSGETGDFRLSKNDLREFISLGVFPIIKDSTIYWNDYV